MIQNEFDDEIKYRLFRSVKEILHPTISKKNISDYKIIIEEDILPVRVFYPKKVTNIEKIIIFIHGNGKVTDCIGKYSDICKDFAAKLDRLIMAIEYKEEKHGYKEMYEKIYHTVEYLYERLEKNGIENRNICLMGDSTGGNIITAINTRKNFPISKEILFYPTLSLEYFKGSKYDSIDKNKDFNFGLLENLQQYFSYIAYKKDLKESLLNPMNQKEEDTPMLILVGNVDSLKDEAKEYANKGKNRKYVEFPFFGHGFLKEMDKELEKEVIEEIKKFL